MDNRGAGALIFWVFTTVVSLIAVGLISRGRAATGLKLVLMGFVVALVALWYGLLTGLADSHGQALPMGNPALGEIALKLAAALILGGIVTGLLTRDAGSVPPALPERANNVPPSV